MLDEKPSNMKRRKSKDRAVDAVKELPHSVEAEQAVIGGLFLDNTAWDRVADKVSEADFFRNDHRLLFRAIHELARRNQPFDLVTLKDHLTAQGDLENAGGEFYLFELAKNTPSAANIVAYAGIVRERSILRRLISVSGDIADSAYYPEGKKAIEILDQSERKVFAIGEQLSRGDGPVAIGSLLAKAIDRVEYLHHTPDALTGTPTGFADLDEITAGLQPADLIIVAGRPSMGKTSFAMNIGEHVAQKSKKPVLIFSMEMPGDALATRLLSSLSRVDQKKVKTGRLEDADWHRLASTLTMMSNTQMYIDDTPALSPNELRARARRLAKQFNGQLGLIIVDYLQLMQVAGMRENRVGEISEISRSLKALAKELNVPIIALSQLNRSLEQRTDKRPVMSDLRECVTGDTLVCLSNGTREPIHTLVGQQPEVLSMNKDGKIIAAACAVIWSTGKKPVYEVHLASGRSIKSTAEHRLYGAKGWVTVDSLAKGDRLALALACVTAEPKAALAKKAESDKDLFWDQVVSITPCGEQEVYDLTVPEYHNWLADGIVTHNSGAIEQDADLILFIYRDEVYNEDSRDKGTAEIIIAKHRNGPTGKVRLTFLGQFTRFENAASFNSGGTSY